MTTLEILKAARELLSVPERWTKRVSARATDGKSCPIDSPNATCWCIVGALGKITDYALPDECTDVLREGLPGSLVSFNDAPERTHAEVLARFDEAIARLEGSATP